MGLRERRKGQQGERELAKLLTEELGQVVERRLGQERDGGADLVVGSTAGEIAVQVKRVERASIRAWLDQAIADAEAGQLPAVAWRASRHGWCVVMTLADWCALTREAQMVGEGELEPRWPEDFVS